MDSFVYFNWLDWIGTFVFAMSGATAARQKNLDLFGIFSLAFITACGGGLLRDLCVGAIPPPGLSEWRYLLIAIVAALLIVGANKFVVRLQHPVLLFDALGLGFFAVYGAHKTLALGQNKEMAILLGMISAIGGGVIRDVLLNRVSIVLRKEIYASAALLGAALEVAGEHFGWSLAFSSWAGILAGTGLRMLSLRYHWNLPRFGQDPKAE